MPRSKPGRRNGVIIRRSDWEYIRNITIDGLDTGFLFCKGVRGTTNAVMANSNITNCKTALKLQELNGIGLAIYNTSFAATRFPVHATALFATNVQFNLCSFIALDNNAEILNEGTESSFRNSASISQRQRSPATTCNSQIVRQKPTRSRSLRKEARGANIIEDNWQPSPRSNNTTVATIVTPYPKHQDATPKLQPSPQKGSFPISNRKPGAGHFASPTTNNSAFQKALTIGQSHPQPSMFLGMVSFQF